MGSTTNMKTNHILSLSNQKSVSTICISKKKCYIKVTKNEAHINYLCKSI